MGPWCLKDLIRLSIFRDYKKEALCRETVSDVSNLRAGASTPRGGLIPPLSQIDGADGISDRVWGLPPSGVSGQVNWPSKICGSFFLVSATPSERRTVPCAVPCLEIGAITN